VRAADLVLGAARIEAEAASRRGDPLADADVRHAKRLRQRVAMAPEYMSDLGSGGELVPASILGENSRALELRDTVNDPNYVTVDASRDRLELANQAGCIEEALDAADTIGAQNSLEKMLAHQLAASHRSSMQLTAQLNRCIERMSAIDVQARESANIQATRLAGAIARLNGSFQAGMLTLQKIRNRGQQVVTVQHVTVSEGGQAVVAGKIAGGRHGNSQGAIIKND
jgi:hypothetical protein